MLKTQPTRRERRHACWQASAAAGLLIFPLAGCGGVPLPMPAGERPATQAAPSPEEQPATAGLEVAFEGQTTIEGEQALSSGVLSVESLGLGTVDASAPARLTLGQSGTVRVEIAPLYDPDEVEVEAYVTVTAVDDPVEVLNFYDELHLYSIMSAQISAPGFDVDSATPALQRLSAEAPALWAWNVIPRLAGRRSVTVSISVPVIIDGQVQQVSTSPLQTIEFIIEVSAPPTPIPTPTLLPTPAPGFVARTLDEFGPEIAAAVILGLLSALGTYITNQLRQRGKRSKKR